MANAPCQRKGSILFSALLACCAPLVVAGASGASVPTEGRLFLKRAVHHMNTSDAMADPVLRSLLLSKQSLMDDSPLAGGRRAQNSVPIYGPYISFAYFYALVSLGTPPQVMSVIADTGSSLTAVSCTSCPSGQCGNHQHPAYNPEASTTSVALPCSECSNSCSNGFCTYTVSYAEGSSIGGLLYTEQAYLTSDVSADASRYSPFSMQHFRFGCQTHEGGLFMSQYADGIMGVGHSGSIINSLWDEGKMDRKMFSLCLTLDGGAMTTGHVDTKLHDGGANWASLGLAAHYEVRINNLVVGGQ
jgi:hypothetical protein